MNSIIKLKFNNQNLNMVITSPSQYFDEDKNIYIRKNTNIITTEPNNSHIQKMIEELKSIFANIKKCKITKEEIDIIGKYLKNISTQTYFLYENIDENSRNNRISFQQNKKGSIYNYYKFLGYIKNSKSYNKYNIAHCAIILLNVKIALKLNNAVLQYWYFY